MGDFEHHSTFEQGEVGGNVVLGKYEAHYGELFSDVIEDGVITPDERAQLDRMATALGLDKERLKKLEQALEAAYEERFRSKVVEVGEPGAERASISPIDAPTDARAMALSRRIEWLEARVAELEAALADARSNVAVEVDLSGVQGVADAPEDPAPLQRRLAHDPRDADTLRALYRVYAKMGDVDRQLCVAHALVYLGAANDDEKATYVAHREAALIRPKTSLTQEAWRRLLFHPDEEILTGEIFAVIVSALLLGRVSALRRDRALVALDPARRQDPALSTIQAVRCFTWGAAILGMNAPPLYADPELDALVEMVPGVPPSTRLGRRALTGRSSGELAFIAGRHLAWYRAERFVRLLVPQIADLEELFLAALAIGNPGIPLRPETKRRVAPLAQAIEPILEPIQVDRLRGYFLRFVEEGGRTNLQRWATAADRTAARAGLLLANDLRSAAAMLESEDPTAAKDRIDDLLVFVVSDRYASLRKQIGIAVGT